MLMQRKLQERLLQQGFSLVELLIAIALGLVITLALLLTFENVVRTSREMAKSNEQIENGRFAVQILENDIKHAGFWGTYVPVYDDLTSSATPSDAPTAIPDPCLPYDPATWNSTYLNGLIGIPVQVYRTPPANCTFITNQKANTDILVVRHAETCAIGETGCEALNNNKLYFQSSLCVGSAQTGTASTITLAAMMPATASVTASDTIRIIGGTGAGQSRQVSSYVSGTKVVNVTASWNSAASTPDNTSIYTFGQTDFILDKGSAAFRLRGTGCGPIPAGASQFAPIRKYVSNIYYVRDDGNNKSTLMRARMDVVGTTPDYVVEPIIEGIDGFRVEIGADTLSETGLPPTYTVAVNWASPTLRTQATNRGDGVPDTYCNSATCTISHLINAVRVKVFVLSKTTDTMLANTDTKTYCLATIDSSGACPTGYSFTPSSGDEQRYSRHVFATTVRINNVSGRRETP